jgi:hypothetical protein
MGSTKRPRDLFTGVYWHAIKLRESAESEMIEFSCPRCGRGPYHADESQIGKSIRCTKPGCGEIITIAWQDARYTTSGQKIQCENARQARSDKATKYWKESTEIKKTASKRPFVFTSLAIVILVLLLTGYFLGTRKNVSGSNSGVTGIVEQAKPTSAPTTDSQPPTYLTFDDIDPTSPPSSKKKIYKTTKQSGEEESRQMNPPEVAKHSNPTTIHPVNSPPTGTQIIPDLATSGNGILVAKNGTSLDAYVMVVSLNGQRRVREHSIQANDSDTLDHLDPGSYRVVFATGLDWDSKNERYKQYASYFEFGSILDFHEYKDSEKIHYERHTITLYPVLNGNVKARHLSETEFHELSMKR